MTGKKHTSQTRELWSKAERELIRDSLREVLRAFRGDALVADMVRDAICGHVTPEELLAWLDKTVWN